MFQLKLYARIKNLDYTNWFLYIQVLQELYIFNRLPNSQVLVPDWVKQIVILSSTFDGFLPCDHVISSNNIEVYTHDKEVLWHCVC